MNLSVFVVIFLCLLVHLYADDEAKGNKKGGKRKAGVKSTQR